LVRAAGIDDDRVLGAGEALVGDCVDLVAMLSD
jgi:hypothetical protein